MKYSLVEEKLDITKDSENNLVCDFCEGTGGDREYMFKSKGKLCICDECVLICAEVIDKDELEEKEESNKTLPLWN